VTAPVRRRGGAGPPRAKLPGSAAGIQREEKLMRSSPSVLGRPRRTVLPVAVAALLAVALAPALSGAPASAGAAGGGTSLVAETSGGHVGLVLSRDGRQVRRAFVAYRVSCSDGTGFTDFDAFRSIPISSAGTFRSSYDSGARPSAEFPGATARFTGTVEGRVNRARTRIAGTARFRLAITSPDPAMAGTCDTGTIRFTAKD
jgi:hypothetical protein